MAALETPTSVRSLGRLALLGAAVASTAYLGSRSTQSSVGGWYRLLRKPPYQPPRWVFAPAWTLLYATMTLSAWRVMRTPPSAARSRALSLWTAQLALNGIWSPLFFGARRTRLAMADLALLFAAIGAYTAAASRVDKRAAAMMAPYMAWVAFAGLLNEEVIRRNPSQA